MHELNCPSCNTPSQYELRDYLHLCPYCSITFNMDYATGNKQIYSDHYIVPNLVDSKKLRETMTEWFRRFHHNPNLVESEFKIVKINGISIPFWVITMEVHTKWRGYVTRKIENKLDASPNAKFLTESGTFRRTYRWAVSARSNIHESWGMIHLHEPHEDIKVQWDGFPLESTFSRGAIVGTSGSNDIKNYNSIYESKEHFDFRFANGSKILSIQIDEQEAVRRAKRHLDEYHLMLAREQCDNLIDIQTEFDMGGIQLIHIPVWNGTYIYRPQGLVRYLTKYSEKNILLEGLIGGILKGEIVMVQEEKLVVNTYVTAALAALFMAAAIAVHPGFVFVGLFFAMVAIASLQIAKKRADKRTENVKNHSDSHSPVVG